MEWYQHNRFCKLAELAVDSPERLAKFYNIDIVQLERVFERACGRPRREQLVAAPSLQQVFAEPATSDVRLFWTAFHVARRRSWYV